jgi:hypothetical protein
MSETSRRQPVSYGTTCTRPNRVSAPLSPSSPAVPTGWDAGIQLSIALNTRLCETDHMHSPKSGILTMHSKALRAPTTGSAKEWRVAVPAPIILSIIVLMTITAATSATCWTGLQQARAIRPSHVPPFRSRDRRARDRDSDAPAIASAAIDATGVCRHELPCTGPGELRVGLDARRAPLAPRRGVQTAHCWRFLWRNATRSIPAR